MKNKPKMKSFFKVAMKANESGIPSVQEVEYKGADGQMYKGIQFEGYASTKDPDRGNDIVEPKAFKDALELYMENSVILLQHNKDKPIGSVVEAYIDDVGLYVKGIVKTDKDNIFQDLRTGVIKTMSFGYRVNDYEVEERDTGEGMKKKFFVIKQLELFEVSLVSVPMNPKAHLKGNPITKKEDIPAGLDDEEYKSLFNIDADVNNFPLYKSANLLLNNIEHIVTKDVDGEQHGEEETPSESTGGDDTGEVTTETPAEVPAETTEEVATDDTPAETVETTETTETAETTEVVAEVTEETTEVVEASSEEAKSMEAPEAKNLQPADMVVGQMYRFKKTYGGINYYGEDWSWHYVANAELVKISTTEEGASEANPMLYFLEYELDLNGYIPTTYVIRSLLLEIEVVDVTEEQLKELQSIDKKPAALEKQGTDHSLEKQAHDLETQVKGLTDTVNQKDQEIKQLNDDLAKSIEVLGTAKELIESKSKQIEELTTAIKGKDELLQKARETYVKRGGAFINKEKQQSPLAQALAKEQEKIGATRY